MIHIGITGTRRTPKQVQYSMLYNALRGFRWEQDDVTLHHGDCVGADAAGNKFATQFGFTTVAHPPTNPRHRAFCASDTILEPKKYMDRNADIVNAISILIAMPYLDIEEKRSGTWATVRMARKQAKRIVILWPTGCTTEENPL